MAKQPNTTLLSISVLDNKRFCQTPTELAVLAAENGSPAGPLIRALNSIGVAIEPEFPQVRWGRDFCCSVSALFRAVFNQVKLDPDALIKLEKVRQTSLVYFELFLI